MVYSTIIISAAKAIGIPGSLLLSICMAESNLKNVASMNDGGSPSYGICQIKLDTAKMLGFKGKANDLMIPKTNAKWAAKYVARQLKRYDDDWCKAAAAYNSGTYRESKKFPGKPKNYKYLKKIQKNLKKLLKKEVSCDMLLEDLDEEIYESN